MADWYGCLDVLSSCSYGEGFGIPLIEAQAYTVQTSDPSATQYARGDRVFHQKFGYGRVTGVEGNKLTVNFDHSGEKKVIDTFVTRG